MPPIVPTATGIRLAVQVQPRASRNELVGRHGEALKVRLQAPPVEGAANDGLIRFLAERLGVPRAAVRIVAGSTSRRKTVLIDGISPAEAGRRLALEVTEGSG